MDKEEFDDLIKKYEQGESSLTEEQIIFEHSENMESSSHAWYTFVKRERRKAPTGLQSDIWEAIDKKQKTIQRWRAAIISALALILLLLSIAIYKPFDSTQSHETKEALLNEALRMFENTDSKSELKSIYEDDMIIIYASAE